MGASLSFLASHAQANDFPNTSVPSSIAVDFCFWSGNDGDNAKVDGYLDMLQRAGVGAIRLDMQWTHYQDDDRHYHPERFDHTWEACAARNIRIDALIGASGRDFPKFITAPVGSQQFDDEIGQYTIDLVTRYLPIRDGLHAQYPHWESGITWDLWNEPNLQWASPPSVMPGNLMSALRWMTYWIHSFDTNPRDTITAPSLAYLDTRPLFPDVYGTCVNGSTPCGPCQDGTECKNGICTDGTNCTSYAGYLEAMFQQGLLQMVDGVSVHPYRPSGPETVITPQPQSPKPGGQYYPGTYSSLRTLMNAYGGQNVKIIENEWGWSSFPSFGLGDITEQRQADYLARMMLTNLSYQDGYQNGIPLSVLYQVSDGNGQNPESEGHFGLLHPLENYNNDFNFARKPSYYALQTLTQSLRNVTFYTKLDAGQSNVHLSLFRAPFSNTQREILAAWTDDNTITVNRSQNGGDLWGTYLLNGTPLYVGQRLTWHGGDTGNWSNTLWQDGYGWPNDGFQARFDTAAHVNVDGTYTISGIQFNNQVNLDGGMLKFTPGGGNIYVADGHWGTIGTTVIADSTMVDPVPDHPGPPKVLNNPASFSLRKCGGGELALFGNNTFHGGILVGEGFIYMGHDNALGDASNPITLAGGALDFNGHSPTTGALAISGNSMLGNCTGNTTSLYSFESATIGSDFSVNGAGNLDLVGQIDLINGARTITKNDTGTLYIGGPGVYMQDKLTFNTVQGTVMTAPIIGTGDVFKEGTGTLEFLGANSINGRTVVDAGTLQVLGINYSGAIIVNTGGTLNLLGTINTSAGITINGGALYQNSSSPLTAAIDVQNGGTFGGIGTYQGNLDISGRLSPGSAGLGAIGPLTVVGDLRSYSTTVFDFDILSTTSYDKVAMSGGSVTLAGMLNLHNRSGGTWIPKGTYTLMSGFANIPSLANLNLVSLPSGRTYLLWITNTNCVGGGCRHDFAFKVT